MSLQFEQITTALERLGLSQNEALVYLAALELGPSRIWDIAKKSGVKRTSCYVILDDLAAKGFVSSSSDGARMIFTAVSPRQFLRMAEYNYEQLVTQVAQLEGLASKSSQKPVVQFYEGAEGIKQVYNQILESPRGSEHLMVGVNMRLPEAYADFIEDFIATRAKRGIHTRVVYPDIAANVEHAKRDKEENRETRFVPAEKLDARTQLYVFGDSVAYFAYAEQKPFATVMENQAIAYDEKMRFNLLWEIAKKPEEMNKV